MRGSSGARCVQEPPATGSGHGPGVRAYGPWRCVSYGAGDPWRRLGNRASTRRPKRRHRRHRDTKPRGSRAARRPASDDVLVLQSRWGYASCGQAYRVLAIYATTTIPSVATRTIRNSDSHGRELLGRRLRQDEERASLRRAGAPGFPTVGTFRSVDCSVCDDDAAGGERFKLDRASRLYKRVRVPNAAFSA
jgi:hypothetical protein